MHLKKIILFLVLVFCVASLYAQTAKPPFYDEVMAFKKKDSLTPPPENAILFVGSSSFRKWTDAEQIFKDYPVVNRGFGGSSLPDVIRYADDIIFPYQPRQILIYCGDNDLAASDTVSVGMVAQRFRQLFSLIRSRLKTVSIAFVSIKPSPARKHLMPKMADANRLIKQFLRKQKKTGFIDVYHPMLLPGGYPNGALFESDSLHMLPAGYAIWKEKIEPVLIKRK